MKIRLLGNHTTTVEGKRTILQAGVIVELADKEAKALISMNAATRKLTDNVEEEPLDKEPEEKEERRKKK